MTASVAGLWSDTTVGPDHVVLHLHGTLSLATVAPIRRALNKLLADGSAVVVDLAELQLRWRPAAGVFPATLAAAGGWPGARMVLACADPALTRELEALRIPRTVPLAVGTADAVERIRHRPDRTTRHLQLPREPGAAAAAREFVRVVVHDWDVPVVLDAAALIATELVTNAVQHARTPSRLTLSLDASGLRVTVRDYRPGPAPRPRPVDTATFSGRGLHLVAVLARRWGSQGQVDGKTVWALLDTAAPADATRPAAGC